MIASWGVREDGRKKGSMAKGKEFRKERMDRRKEGKEEGKKGRRKEGKREGYTKRN